MRPVKCYQFLETNFHNKHISFSLSQTQIGGKKNTVILLKLTPDTPYSITVAAIYASGDVKDISGQGKTCK